MMTGTPHLPIAPKPDSASKATPARPGFRRGIQILLELEPVIVYSLAVIASLIGMVVWGATKIGRGQGALFENLQWLFGTVYGILVGLILISLFAGNRKWRGVAFVIGAWFVSACLESMKLGSSPINIDRFFGLGAMLSSIAAALFVHSESNP
jgi:hypothetical protein